MRKGQVLSERYRLESLLRGDDKSEVWQARDSVLKRDVTVKVFLAYQEGPALVSALVQFRREGRIVARLNHESIAAIYDCGRDGQAVFLAYEHLRGRNLEEEADRHPGGMPLAAIVTTGRQVAAALSAVHAADVVHLDIKPSSIMLDDRGPAKLCDFGQARILGATVTLSQSTAIKGMFEYIAPEQLLGHEVTASADIYSLGAVLYRLLTGRPVFADKDARSLIKNHVSAPPDDPRDLRPSCPPELASLVLEMLGKDPATRPDAAAAEAALARVGPGRKVTPGWIRNAPFAMPQTYELSSGARHQVLGFSPDSRILISGDGRIRLWNIAEQTARAAYYPDDAEDGVADVRFSRSGAKYGAVPREGSGLFAIEPVGGNDIYVNRCYGFQVWRQFDFSPDDRLVVACGVGDDGQGQVGIWGLTSDGPSRALVDVPEAASVMFSPDGERIIVGGAEAASVWQVDHDPTHKPIGQRLLTIPTGQGMINQGLALSPDGSLLVSLDARAETGQVVASLWSMPDGRRVGTVSQPGRMTRPVFSPAGDAIAAPDPGTGMRIWNAAGDLLTVLPMPDAVCAAFSPDGRYLAVGGDKIYLLDLTRRSRGPRRDGLRQHILDFTR